LGQDDREKDFQQGENENITEMGGDPESYGRSLV
jgi:hypothetical protein